MSVKKNLVKAATSTTGTGTLTLSALTGWALFSAAYANGDVVPYAIENGDNKEVGLGTVGASNTLARTTVLATLVAGVYDDTSPAAISLTGTSTVSSGPLAELFAASEISGLGTAALADTGSSGHVVPFLDDPGVTFTDLLTVMSTDSEDGGPQFNLYHDSASPAVGDLCGATRIYGNNSTGAQTEYISFRAFINNATESFEEAILKCGVIAEGGINYPLILGRGVYADAATGGDQGYGTANFVAVYDDGAILTCYAIEAAVKGSVDQARWDDASPKGEHAPAARFAGRVDAMLDPARYAESWKATGHLPAMPSPAEWEASGKRMALGDIQQRLWETVEVQAVHIDKLVARIESLEARVTALGG